MYLLYASPTIGKSTFKASMSKISEYENLTFYDTDEILDDVFNVKAGNASNEWMNEKVNKKKFEDYLKSLDDSCFILTNFFFLDLEYDLAVICSKRILIRRSKKRGNDFSKLKWCQEWNEMFILNQLIDHTQIISIVNDEEVFLTDFSHIIMKQLKNK